MAQVGVQLAPPTTTRCAFHSCPRIPVPAIPGLPGVPCAVTFTGWREASAAFGVSGTALSAADIVGPTSLAAV